MKKELKHLLGPQKSPRSYGSDEIDADDSDDSNDVDDEVAKANLLRREERFTICYNAQKGYRGTELKLSSFARPHMRAFHASWCCFFASFFTQFAMAPLLPIISQSLNLTKKEVWQGNLAMMVGGIPMRLMIGPLVEKHGGRGAMTTIVVLSGVVCGLSGLVFDATSLSITRFVIGAMDTFVPCQFWITCLFVREVAATAMAIAGGLGSVGSAFTQVALGTAIFPLLAYALNGDEDLAWRLTLIFPGLFSVAIGCFFYKYSDDCPLGNFEEVKRAGLMVERSAVDSFRSG
jgi:MFS transporter, NNP family, nitrate/nitrite transporter